jgi:hypothetical protein
MHIENLRGAIAPAWILTAGLVGVFGNVTSIRGAALVLGIGLIPPTLLMLRWSRAVQPATVTVRR